MNKNCPKCGFQNPDASKFCAKCGTTLKDAKDVSEQQVQQPEQKPTEYTPPVPQPQVDVVSPSSQVPKSSNKMVLGLAVVAIVLSAAALSSAFLITPELTIDSSSVGQDELKDNSVTSNKIVDDTITDDDISDNAIKSNHISNNVIKSSHILDNSITFQDLASDVYTKIFNQTIVSEDIANDSITSDKIKNYTIATNDLANNSVTSNKIADGTITSDDIGSGAVDTAELAADAVTYDKMAIKIKCGIEENVKHGDTINHDLGVGYLPTSVVVTPVYDYTYESGTAVIHANTNNVTTTSFDIALWIEIEYDNLGNPPPDSKYLHKVDGSLDYPSQDVYWIAIYDPNA